MIGPGPAGTRPGGTRKPTDRRNERSRVVVWRFVDGKPGHEKQSAGLLQALAERVPVEVHQFDVRFNVVLRRQLWGHATNTHVDIPVPDLILGVGHRTHLPMLLTRAICGGKVVVLMKPSLPHRLFDLVFVPHHDRYWRKGNLVETRGVICPVIVAEKRKDHGLILLGGENRFFAWDNDEVARQVEQITRASPSIQWIVCDSRRTPEGLAARIDAIANATFLSWRDAPSNFLENALASTPYVWVTADSVSMLYESLSSKALVGVVVLRRKRPNQSNKLVRGIDLLQAQGHVHLTSDGYRLEQSLAPPHFFGENYRCAKIIEQRLLA